jgi:ribosomal protein S18 acetylase RimI-like enzyme
MPWHQVDLRTVAPDDQSIDICVAIEEDLPGIRRAMRSSIQGLAYRDYPQSSAKQRQAIRESRELTWVAVREGTIVGCSALDPESGTVRAVCVAAEAARRGIGSRLLAEVERSAHALGIAAGPNSVRVLCPPRARVRPEARRPVLRSSDHPRADRSGGRGVIGLRRWREMAL